MKAVLEDWQSLKVPEHLRAMLGFLRKLTLEPDKVVPEDIQPLRAAGISEEAIVHAIHVCAAFNMIDRVADTLGFAIPTPESFARGAKSLLQRGYAM